MRIRNDTVSESKSDDAPSAQIATPATEITQVVAKVAGKSQAPAAEQPSEPLADASPEYVAAVESVRSAMIGYGRATWKLAWALMDFREIHHRLHPADRLSDAGLAAALGINLTPARIGQLINTAEAYPRDQVDESIDFRVYEEARKFTIGRRSMTPAKRLKFVVAHPSAEEIARLKAKKPTFTTPRSELIIRIKQATGADGEPEIVVRLNGATVDVSAKVRSAFLDYAAEAFAGVQGANKVANAVVASANL